MKVRNEQLEAMGQALGLDFGPRLAECLRQWPSETENAGAVVAFCLAKAPVYSLETEREVAAFALALCSRRGGFQHEVPSAAQTILRDLRVESPERLERLSAWAGDEAGEIAPVAAQFGDVPAGGLVVPGKKAVGGERIVVQLLDEAGWGVEGETYCVELANGVRACGYLDAAGEAVVSGIEDPGVCQVSFPNLDEAVWERMP